MKVKQLQNWRPKIRKMAKVVKALFNKIKNSKESLFPSAVKAAWEEYSKDRFFDDPSEVLQAKRAFEAGFSAAEAFFKKEIPIGG